MSPARTPLRRPLLWFHRWLGLVLGGWFALLGLSGSVLVWHDELDAWLNPGWLNPQPACGAPARQPVARALLLLREAQPHAKAATVSAPHTPGAAYVVWERADTRGLRRQHFIDVTCGRYLGGRAWGAGRIDRAHLVPAVYELHRSLLSGALGHSLVGFCGLVLLGLTLFGLVLAWPRGWSRAAWARIFSIKRGAAPQRMVFDLHRATGMWLLPFLVLMTVSGAYLCFPQSARALVGSALPVLESGVVRHPPAATPNAAEPDALAAAAQALWPEAQWSRIQLPADSRGTYEVRLRQRGELRADTGDTRVRLDAQGRLTATRDALNLPSGEALLAWLFPLHSAEALGGAGRLAWTALGLGPALLFASSAWFWWRRRDAQPARHRPELRAGGVSLNATARDIH